jgi:predicted metal-dependent enzyme (double-stranded beta helix superfamily)
MKWDLAACLQDALQLPTIEDSVQHVKESLSAAIQAGSVDLDETFRRPADGHYARRLLYRNPKLGVSAVVMTWGAGQATAVHDHSGMWCVEGVVEGEINVTQYDLLREDSGRYYFERKGDIQALVGQTGALIPPFEYHVLSNPTTRTAITLHIYGGEMETCSVYLPDSNGAWLREEKTLAYDAWPPS